MICTAGCELQYLYCRLCTTGYVRQAVHSMICTAACVFGVVLKVKVKSPMARSLPVENYYHRMWGQLSTTSSNLLK